MLDLYLTNGYISAERGRVSGWYSEHRRLRRRLLATPPTGRPSKTAVCPATSRSTSGSTKAASSSRRPPAWACTEPVRRPSRRHGRLVESRRARRDCRRSGWAIARLQNTVAPGNHWVQFELEGTASNRSTIGAEVRLFWKGRQQGRRKSYPGATATPRNGSDVCTSAWVRRRRSTKSLFNGRPGIRKPSTARRRDRLHAIKEWPSALPPYRPRLVRPSPPPGKPRPPFGPWILFLGLAVTLALLAGQYWFESALRADASGNGRAARPATRRRTSVSSPPPRWRFSA